MALAQSYSLVAVQCSVGGVGLSGYGATDAIGWQWAADIAEVFTSADGQHVYSRKNDRGIFVQITLHAESRAYPLLAGLMNLQWGESTGVTPANLPPLPFLLVDPSNGDTLAAPTAVFVRRPNPSKGPTVSEVQFVLHLSQPKVINGVLNVA